MRRAQHQSSGEWVVCRAGSASFAAHAFATAGVVACGDTRDRERIVVAAQPLQEADNAALVGPPA